MKEKHLEVQEVLNATEIVEKENEEYYNFSKSGENIRFCVLACLPEFQKRGLVKKLMDFSWRLWKQGLIPLRERKGKEKYQARIRGSL